jgi:hypothetical protein
MPVLTQLSPSSALKAVTTTTTSTVLEESIAVDAAASKAIDLINKFSTCYNNDKNNSDGTTNNNPEEMYHLLDLARNDIMVAWNRLQNVSSQQNNKQQEEESTVRNYVATETEAASTTTTTTNMSNNVVDLRPAFIDMITDAFGDVLDNLRQSEEIDVSILVDCLQSGLEIMSSDVINDDEFLWTDDYDNTNVVNEEDDDDDDDYDDDDMDEEETTKIGVEAAE